MADTNASVKIGADLSQFQKALKEVKTSLRDAKAEFALVKSAVGDFANSFDGLNKVIDAQNSVVDKNAAVVKNLQEQLEAANKAENKSAEQIEKIQKALVKAQTSYNNSVKVLKEYKEQQTQLAAKQKESESALGQLNTKIAKNKDELAKAKTEYQNIVLSQGKMSKEAITAREKIKELSTELNNNQKELKESTEEVDKFDKSLSGVDTENIKVSLDYVKQAVYDFTKSIAGRLSRVVTSEISSAFKVGMDFETAFAGVKKVVDGTEEDFAGLKNEIRQMAQEKPISSATLASIFQMGAQLGIAKEDLKDFSETVIDLKNTSDLTEEAGATMIAQYANVKKLPSSEYRKFASTLSYLGSTTATTESRIMELAQKMSGTAAVLKMQDKDVLALSTAMSSVGIQAEMGGSAISKIMMQIEKDVANNGEKLKTWAEVANMSTTDFSKLWKENVLGAVQKVMKGLSDSSKGGESLVLILDELGINNIRTTQTMMQLSSASDLLTDCVAKANNEWEKSTFLTNSASEVYKTTEAQMQLLKNAYDEIKISIFESLQEPMLSAMEKIKKALQDPAVKASITNFTKTLGDGFVRIIQNSDKLAKTIKGVATAVVGLIATFTFQKVVVSIASLVTTFVKLVSGIKAATTAQGILNAVIAANPFGAIATAIGLVITALATLVVTTDGFTSASDRELKKVQETTNALQEETKALEDSKKAREDAITGIDNEYNHYQSLIDELKTLVDENGNVKSGYEERVNAIIPLLQDATGTEIQLINNQIVGYNNLIKTLDQVIAKKRAEAKMSAYEGDYKDALKNQESNKKAIEETTQKYEEYAAKVKALGEQGQGWREQQGPDGLMHNIGASGAYKEAEAALKEYGKQLDLLKGEQESYNDTIKDYEDMYADYYKTYMQPTVEVKTEVDSTSAAAAESQIANTYKKASVAAAKASGKAKKEETHTTYQELLNQEKLYKDQLSQYLQAMKAGNSEVTVEMVEETNKNLEAVQKKVKEIKTLMGDNTVSTKLQISDESYGGLKKKETELKTQLDGMQKELAAGNASITKDMLSNVSKQIDQVQSKIKALKNEWKEIGEDGEISDEFESENTDHKSTGVIFGKGVLGEEAVEMNGAGKDAAVQFLEGYKQQKKAQEADELAAITEDAVQRATNEATQYQVATLEPSNVAVYQDTERIIAENKQIAQAQGLTDNQYRVINAEIATLNAAKTEAMKIDFTCVGRYICEGIVRGIESNKGMVISAVRAMMEEANEAAEDEEEIESPSKVFYRYGMYIDKGLANGIKAYAGEASDRIRDVAQGLNMTMQKENIGAKGGIGLSGGANNIVNYNFTQNNQSNKSLDTLAIYNESKSLLKRAVREVYV